VDDGPQDKGWIDDGKREVGLFSLNELPCCSLLWVMG
jgi:hypothetical protein